MHKLNILHQIELHYTVVLKTPEHFIRMSHREMLRIVVVGLIFKIYQSVKLLLHPVCRAAYFHY